jgi:site-specific DNA-methyltransferase (adenine-specific)
MSCCFIRGDVFDCINRIPAKSINLLYCDPPFGTTKQYWDDKIEWSTLFAEFFRVLKDDGVIVIHCSIPFTYELIRAAPKAPLYEWFWKKGGSPTGYLSANHQPLREIESVLVWKKKKTVYFRQQIGDEERISYTACPNEYYGSVQERKKKVIKGKTRTHFLEMKRSLDGYSTRPREMIELMIQSYTQEGDTILDPFCYKGVCGVIAKELGRHWTGFDKYHYPELLMTSSRN